MDNNEFDWMDEIKTPTPTQPKTLYYFEPPLSAEELGVMLLTVPKTDYHRKRLEKIERSITIYNPDSKLNYFATPSEFNDDPDNPGGWCNTISYGEALNDMYEGYTPVNGREYFNL